MATSSEATAVLQMVEESSLHDIIKLNEQNLVKIIKKLDYRETDEILATDDLENVNEHYGLMRQLYKESQEIVINVQQLKIEADLPIEDIDEWRDEQRSLLTKPGEDLQKIKRLLDESRIKEEKKRQMEQESKEFEMRERIRQEQVEYEKKQRKLVAEEHKRQELEIMENRRKFEEKLEQDRLKHIREARMAPKPPRLQITIFRGTVLDWPRFWAQFKEDIDETELKPVKKFNLLKELVGETDRTVIENLPSDEAGYNRAKKLLEDKYGDKNEIVAAYTKQIAQLPTIHGVDVNKIHAFYAKLASCVHVLETMKLIGDIKGNLRMTLN